MPPLARLVMPGALVLVLAGCTVSTPIRPTASTAPGPPLPNPSLTSGAIGQVGTSLVCPHVARSLERQRPNAAEIGEVYQAYGLSYPQPPGRYELDHLIPIRLGGAPDDPANEWPERNDKPNLALAAKYHIPASTVHNSKDILDGLLPKLVCAGDLPLRIAQAEIALDWPAAYQWYVVQGHRKPPAKRMSV